MSERKNIKRNKTRKSVQERVLYSGIQTNYNRKVKVVNTNQSKLF
jgi:hypothetical protein